MEDHYKRLREFVAGEMRVRNMTLRQFAAIVGADHSTIARLVDTRLNVVPSLELIRKVSIATGAPMSLLIGMIDIEGGQSPRTETDLIAYQLGRLNPDQRRLVLNLIKGFLASE